MASTRNDDDDDDESAAARRVRTGGPPQQHLPPLHAPTRVFQRLLDRGDVRGRDRVHRARRGLDPPQPRAVQLDPVVVRDVGRVRLRVDADARRERGGERGGDAPERAHEPFRYARGRLRRRLRRRFRGRSLLRFLLVRARRRERARGDDELSPLRRRQPRVRVHPRRRRRRRVLKPRRNRPHGRLRRAHLVRARDDLIVVPRVHEYDVAVPRHDLRVYSIRRVAARALRELERRDALPTLRERHARQNQPAQGGVHSLAERELLGLVHAGRRRAEADARCVRVPRQMERGVPFESSQPEDDGVRVALDRDLDLGRGRDAGNFQRAREERGVVERRERPVAREVSRG